MNAKARRARGVGQAAVEREDGRGSPAERERQVQGIGRPKRDLIDRRE